MKQTDVTFACGNIVLEGVWHLPSTNHPAPAVIVCHPHPLYGGDMDNNVVFAICQALAEQGIAALRFNFRGVGNSGGSHGNGIAEQEDVTAALDLAAASPHIDTRRIGLAGYSFGTSVIVPVAVHDSRVELMALVSPALSNAGWKQLKGYTKPKLLISGEHDFVIPVAQFRQHLKEIAEPKQWEIIAGADHFWHGYEVEIAQRVARFFANGFSRV